MRYFLLIFFLSLIAAIGIAGPRGSKTTNPPLEVFPDMDRQARYRPQGTNQFFDDRRNDRPVVSNTIPFITADQKEYPFTAPRDAYNTSDYFRTGMAGEKYGDGFPIDINVEILKEARKNYGIYCQICHGKTGDGNGTMKYMGISTIPDFSTVLTVNLPGKPPQHMPDGQIYRTIAYGSKEGQGLMGGYASKLSINERWGLVAYLHTLQRAANASLNDVPDDIRNTLLEDK